MADALKESQEYYQETLDALSEQRKQIEEDLRFSDPSDPDQWEDNIRRQREGDPGGVRPCLVHDQLGQYTAQVTGQIEKQPPSLHAIPVSGGADKKAAEQLDGRFRHIEHASRATQHYQRAMTSAARAGVGYLIIRPEYVDRALNWQEPRISSEPDPLRIVFDAWSTETDGSDANVAWLMSKVSNRTFKRKWPKKKARDFGSLNADEARDDREGVLIAEQWLKVWQTKSSTVYLDAEGQENTAEMSAEDWNKERQIVEQMSGERTEFVREYTEKKPIIKWAMMSGLDILEESTYPADSIGIVPIYGYVGFSGGRMRYCGIPRRGRAPQQAYNYHISEQLAYMGTAPKNPWFISKRAAKGVEHILDRMAVETRAWVPYNDLDEEGPISDPKRVAPAVNVTNHIQGAEQALKDIQAAVGMYQANIGAPSNETSGVAIESRKEQGESSTAHFPSHMAASLGHVGKIVMQMDARLADTRRQAPILGVDGAAGTVTVDPEQTKAFVRGKDGVSINPTVGTYGVRVVVGASYSTQRTQTNAAFAEIMRGNKELAPVVAPFWAQTLDFPGSDKFAQAMAEMAPPPVKAILKPEGSEDGPGVADLTAQLEQCKQALAEASQIAREAQQDADEAMQSNETAENEAAVKARELEIKAYDAETKRLQVVGGTQEQIAAVARSVVEQMLMQPDPLPGDPPQAEEVREEPEMPEMPQAQPMQPEMQPPEMTQPEPPMTSEGEMKILEGQQQLLEVMGALLQVVKAPRERIPERDPKTGDIQRVLDRIIEQQTD
jgi:Phage P22-like portal protein